MTLNLPYTQQHIYIYNVYRYDRAPAENLLIIGDPHSLSLSAKKRAGLLNSRCIQFVNDLNNDKSILLAIFKCMEVLHAKDTLHALLTRMRPVRRSEFRACRHANIINNTAALYHYYCHTPPVGRSSVSLVAAGGALRHAAARKIRKIYNKLNPKLPMFHC